MDSNPSGAVGETIWAPFHLSREYLKPLKWPKRPDIAQIKPGFVEFGLSCSWRVHEPLQYLSFYNIQTLGQLGSEINVRYVRRERICLFCSTDPVGRKISPYKLLAVSCCNHWICIIFLFQSAVLDNREGLNPGTSCQNGFWIFKADLQNNLLVNLFTRQVWEGARVRGVPDFFLKNFLIFFSITDTQI